MDRDLGLVPMVYHRFSRSARVDSRNSLNRWRTIENVRRNDRRGRTQVLLDLIGPSLTVFRRCPRMPRRYWPAWLPQLVGCCYCSNFGRRFRRFPRRSMTNMFKFTCLLPPIRCRQKTPVGVVNYTGTVQCYNGLRSGCPRMEDDRSVRIFPGATSEA
jgi:hypothetical protein